MPTSLDAFGLGGIMAYLYIYHRSRFDSTFRQTGLVWLGLLILAGSLLWYHLSPDPHLSVNSVFERLAGSIFAFFLIGKAIIGYEGVMKWILENPVSVFLGRISYGLYLYHNFVFNHYHITPTHPVYRLMHRIYRSFPTLEENMVFNFSMYVLLTILVATLSCSDIGPPWAGRFWRSLPSFRCLSSVRSINLQPLTTFALPTWLGITEFCGLPNFITISGRAVILPACCSTRRPCLRAGSGIIKSSRLSICFPQWEAYTFYWGN
ncbi:hypothetical protein COLO4_01383 [Corchorus olitorius]|uniref:Acyltransferase 3 n=1 Tax=Corchorus olitorius TaxID=93759 RepID=A0A1R3L2K7_9ROSI|nr:hypothetical protein COLO4_01383 [Corchorus olitorius]